MRINRAPILVATLAPAAALSVTLAVSGSAVAASPAHRACFGADLSTYARGDGSHGELVSFLARTNGGMGELVQLHQAGQIPDSMIENSCND